MSTFFQTEAVKVGFVPNLYSAVVSMVKDRSAVDSDTLIIHKEY